MHKEAAFKFPIKLLGNPAVNRPMAPRSPITWPTVQPGQLLGSAGKALGHSLLNNKRLVATGVGATGAGLGGAHLLANKRPELAAGTGAIGDKLTQTAGNHFNWLLDKNNAAVNSVKDMFSSDPKATPPAPTPPKPTAPATPPKPDDTDVVDQAQTAWKGTPNWGRGLGVGAGALGAGYLAHKLMGPDEDDEDEEEGSGLKSLIGPAVGLGAGALGAHYLTGGNYGKLLDKNFWTGAGEYTQPQMPPDSGPSQPRSLQTQLPDAKPGASKAGPLNKVSMVLEGRRYSRVGWNEDTLFARIREKQAFNELPSIGTPQLKVPSPAEPVPAPAPQPAAPTAATAPPLQTQLPGSQPGAATAGPPTPSTPAAPAPQPPTQPPQQSLASRFAGGVSALSGAANEMAGGDFLDDGAQTPGAPAPQTGLKTPLPGSQPGTAKAGPPPLSPEQTAAKAQVDKMPPAVQAQTGQSNLAKEAPAEVKAQGPQGVMKWVSDLWNSIPEGARWPLIAGLGLGAVSLLSGLSGKGGGPFGGGLGTVAGIGALAAGGYGLYRGGYLNSVLPNGMQYNPAKPAAPPQVPTNFGVPAPSGMSSGMTQPNQAAGSGFQQKNGPLPTESGLSAGTNLNSANKPRFNSLQEAQQDPIAKGLFSIGADGKPVPNEEAITAAIGTPEGEANLRSVLNRLPPEQRAAVVAEINSKQENVNDGNSWLGRLATSDAQKAQIAAYPKLKSLANEPNPYDQPGYSGYQGWRGATPAPAVEGQVPASAPNFNSAAQPAAQLPYYQRGTQPQAEGDPTNVNSVVRNVANDPMGSKLFALNESGQLTPRAEAMQAMLASGNADDIKTLFSQLTSLPPEVLADIGQQTANDPKLSEAIASAQDWLKTTSSRDTNGIPSSNNPTEDNIEHGSDAGYTPPEELGAPTPIVRDLNDVSSAGGLMALGAGAVGGASNALGNFYSRTLGPSLGGVSRPLANAVVGAGKVVGHVGRPFAAAAPQFGKFMRRVGVAGDVAQLVDSLKSEPTAQTYARGAGEASTLDLIKNTQDLGKHVRDGKLTFKQGLGVTANAVLGGVNSVYSPIQNVTGITHNLIEMMGKGNQADVATGIKNIELWHSTESKLVQSLAPEASKLRQQLATDKNMDPAVRAEHERDLVGYDQRVKNLEDSGQELTKLKYLQTRPTSVVDLKKQVAENETTANKADGRLRGRWRTELETGVDRFGNKLSPADLEGRRRNLAETDPDSINDPGRMYHKHQNLIRDVGSAAEWAGNHVENAAHWAAPHVLPVTQPIAKQLNKIDSPMAHMEGGLPAPVHEFLTKRVGINLPEAGKGESMNAAFANSLGGNKDTKESPQQQEKRIAASSEHQRVTGRVPGGAYTPEQEMEMNRRWNAHLSGKNKDTPEKRKASDAAYEQRQREVAERDAAEEEKKRNSIYRSSIASPAQIWRGEYTMPWNLGW